MLPNLPIRLASSFFFYDVSTFATPFAPRISMWLALLESLFPSLYQSILHGECFCPVVECAYGDRSMRAKRRLRRHFQICHPNRHPQDGQIWPKCEECGMQVDRGNRRHRGSQVCRDGARVQMQREAAVRAVQSLEVVFTAYDVATERREEIERVETFKSRGY